MQHKKVMLVSDQVGFGKVALPAQAPLLSGLGFEVFQLPTCYVSNTFNYGKTAIHDMTPVLRPCLETWRELDFNFDAISLGYLLNQEQLDLMQEFITDYRAERQAAGEPLLVLMDPIMGDDGDLYIGNTLERVDVVREMARYADVLTPNVTEATFLAKRYVGRIELNHDEARDLAEALHEMTGARCVITSVIVDGRATIAIIDDDGFDLLPYREIPKTQLAGTGDLFSGLVLSRLVTGHSLHDAVEATHSLLSDLIERYAREYHTFHGIPIEWVFSKEERLAGFCKE